MSDSHHQKTLPLHGVRVWLSGSVPDSEHSTQEERDSVLRFVRLFAEMVFRQGGHIIHGSHPSFSGILLEQANEHQRVTGRKDALTLVVSRFWSKDQEKETVNSWRNQCLVYETPEATGENSRQKSLRIMRDWMAARCDVVVALGGKWWRRLGEGGGVPEEIQLTMDRKIACFLLGGFGGAAKELIERNPQIFENLKNGLTPSVNQRLATDQNIGTAAMFICGQLELLPLVRGRGSDGVSFRILALDGGGIKGTFTAAVLATWEQQTGKRIVDHFDLVAGTSTGGILAIGLGLGLTANQMLDFYKQRGPIIFPLTSMAGRLAHGIRHFLKPKFSQKVLLRELQTAYYGNGASITLQNSKCRLLIPAYHALRGKSHTFHTPHHPLLSWNANLDCANAALATAAAPTYFSAVKIGNLIAEANYIDGGVWANSPAMAAIVEASCYLKIPFDRIDMLSIGTTTEPLSFDQKAHSGIIRWGKKFVDLLMNAQSESSLASAEKLIGSARFLRVDEKTPPNIYKLDDPRKIENLAALGQGVASDPEIFNQVISRFLNGVTVAPWDKNLP